MHADLTTLADRLAFAVGDYRSAATATVDQLAHPIDVVDAGLPVARLEVVFRSPHVASVAVRDPHDADRIGLVTRARFTAAMTGRLGFGRAVHARRATAELTDFAPMVVPPSAPVSEVAVRAMERFDERRYDDVLVAGEIWRAASTADLVRSLSTQLAVRSLHDQLTGLPHRAMFGHALARRCASAAGTDSRVVVLLLDVRGIGRVNSRHGQAMGDTVLAAVAARLRSAAPAASDLARIDGDEFAVAVSLPGAADDEHGHLLAESLRTHVVDALSEPPAGIDPSAWPGFDSSVVCSAAGAAEPEHLLGLAESRMRAAKSA
ncbi:GGDEF domain-containing protein [Cellulomonas rhizosphaerae]|uniref:Diguanylate cyclase n=1 Tax=Cellulomonas rhizosphaerae TaxID=2293719 RepID=A0A413RKV6_9CELL|nr:diguanylate cyclase [Cellulomonas rhizosphaerae]RHA40119.1 diguanylate cyclase [Cellulomonas rhizosphaerae]